jgi:1-acyl-sn-glycerol-3-phosphate acyltransferase
MAERRDPVAAVLRRGLLSMARRGLRGVWLRGETPAGPFVWAANHHSWWDPFLAAVLLERSGHLPCLVMLQENLARYGFVRRLGVFGTAEPRRGLAYLREGRALVIFPEGEMRPPGQLGDLAHGAAWYARQAGAPLCAVGVRVILRGHEAPEAYASCTPIDGSGPLRTVTGRLAGELTAQLADVDRLAAAGDPREPLPGFRLAIRGRRSWDERIDAMARWRAWRR